MPIVSSLIVPHPPVMVPSIGGKEGVWKVEKTIKAMLELTKKISELDPDLFILISPHSTAALESISLRMPVTPVLTGDFSMFGSPDLKMEVDYDKELANKLIKESREDSLHLLGTDEDILDYGFMVPMYYLLKGVKKKIKVVTLNISFDSYQKFFELGRIVNKVCKKDNRKIVFLASADLSHSLTKEAPAGFNKEGKKFDDKLISLLEKNEIEAILNLDPFWVDEASECGLRSICTALGVMSERDYKFKTLSYEAPYGVGYLVGSFEEK